MEFYSAITRNELLIHVATWTNVKVTMLSKNNRPIDQTRKKHNNKKQTIYCLIPGMLLLLLLSRFSHVQLCATPQTTAHQAPLSLGFSRQEHWSGLPFPSPMHESEK